MQQPLYWPATGAHKGLGAGPPATGGGWQGFDEMVALGLGVPLAARGSPLEAHPFLLLVVCFFLPGLAVDLETPEAPAPFEVQSRGGLSLRGAHPQAAPNLCVILAARCTLTFPVGSPAS